MKSYFIKNKVALVLTLLIALTMIILYNIILPLDKTIIYDWFTNIKNPGSAPKEPVENVVITKTNPYAREDIVLVVVDNRTLQYDKLGEWPIPRKHYIKVFENFLDENGLSFPKAVIFDIALLSARETDALYEEKLAASIKKNNNVLLQYYLSNAKSFNIPDKDALQYIENKYSIPMSNLKFNGKPITKDIYEKLNKMWTEIIPVYPVYIDSEKYLAVPSFIEDFDKTYRRIPLIYAFNGRIHFNTIFSVYLDMLGVTINDIVIDLNRAITIPKKNIRIPIDAQGTLLVDFIGNSGQVWHTISMYDVYANRVPKEYFKDKFVFIGVYSLGTAKDNWNTPAGLMFGVEYLATSFNQIMQNNFYTHLPVLFDLILILIITFSVIIIASKLKIYLVYIITFAEILIYTMTAYYFFKKYIVLPYFAVVFSMILSLFVLIGYRILTEEKEKRFIRATFSNFVSKVVVDELLKYPEKIKLGGEKKTITVLFSDIRGFTNLSEKHSPEDIVAILNKYLSKMTDIILKNHGTLDKYVGDEIMAFWNAPVPQKDHAVLTCLTALEMMAELKIFNSELSNDQNLDIGIGINTGEAIVGNMGSTSRMDYTLIGDHVNLGARLEGTNKVYKTNIIISQYTYECIKDYFVVRLLDKIKVQGKLIPVEIYELLDIKDNVNFSEIVKFYDKKNR